jgi:uncharacterized membrane protein YGL010W
MRRADELLCSYAAYHRDRRNIATHFVGVPMIVLAICVLLSRPAFPVGSVIGEAIPLTPALVVFVLASLWYLTRGHLLLGAVTSGLIGLMVLAAGPLAAASTATWLGTGLGLFIVGWLIQFAGHWYEGRKPAFVDDLAGLLVGPMFVVAEGLFALGWNHRLQRLIEIEAGPTVLRDLSAIRP